MDKLKRITNIVFIILITILSIYCAFNVSLVYLIPLIFEILIIIINILKLKKKYKFKYQNFYIIKNIIFLVTLVLAILSNKITINEIFLKILLTLIICLDVIILIKINKNRK